MMQTTYTIAKAARAAGVHPTVLRNWEARYGWPHPRRNQCGVREFTDAEIAAIRRFVLFLDTADKPASKFIVDGEPVYPSKKPVKPRLSQTIGAEIPADPAVASMQRRLLDRLDSSAATIGILESADLRFRPCELIRYFVIPTANAIRNWRSRSINHRQASALTDWIVRRCTRLAADPLRLRLMMRGEIKLVRFVESNGGNK